MLCAEPHRVEFDARRFAAASQSSMVRPSADEGCAAATVRYELHHGPVWRRTDFLPRGNREFDVRRLCAPAAVAITTCRVGVLQVAELDFRTKR